MEQNPYESRRELGYIPPRPIANTILGMRRSFAIVAAIISVAILCDMVAGCVFVLLANR